MNSVRANHLWQLLLLATALLTSMFARTALAPLQEAIRQALGFSDNSMALLQGAVIAVPMAIGAIPVGYCADRMSRAAIVRLAVGCGLASCLIPALVSSLPLLALARCLAGFASAAALISTYSLVGDIFSPTERGRASTLLASGEFLGAPLCFALAGWLLVHFQTHALPSLPFPLSGIDAPWRAALLCMSLALVPIFLLMFFVRDHGRSHVEETKLPARQALAMLWQYRMVALPVLFARGMVWMADGAVFVWAAPSFERRLHLSADEIGALMGTVLLASGLIGAFGGGVLADFCQKRGGPRLTMLSLAAVSLVSVPTSFFPLMPTAGMAGIAMFAFLTLGLGIATSGVALSIVIIPPQIRGFYLGISFTFGSIFFVGLAPLAVSTLATALGGGVAIATALAAVCCTASVLGAIIFLVSSKTLPGKELQAVASDFDMADMESVGRPVAI